MKKILFIDRDGTIIQEPDDEQIDAFEKLKFVPGVIRNLAFLRQHTDYLFVMVSNQDGLGTDAFPEDTFWPVHNFILDTLKGEGVDASKFSATGGHVVVRMQPGGSSYYVFVLDDSDFEYRVLSIHGPYSCQ